MSAPPQDIAIIGAGLGGLSLALGLQSKGIQCTIYEQSPESGRFSGAIMLSPNSLHILDAYGFYKRVRTIGWNFESCELKNDKGETTERYWLGNERLFGYKALRIYRNVLVKELQAVVKERGVPIIFDTKYSNIVSEDTNGVTFAFTNGKQASASLLVAADGIHSKVRSYVAPGFEPVYNGIVAVVGAVNRSKLIIPQGERITGPLMYSGKAGMFIIAPQDVDGSEIMAGTQTRWPDMDREGWAKFASDKAQLRAIFQPTMDDGSEIVRSAIEGIDMDTVYIWPQHTLPQLPRWLSEGGKVVLMGDSAHTIPPTTGQGGGQAIEDGFSLALLLSKLSDKINLASALGYWKEIRQARVDKLSELTSKLNNMRLPKEEQEKLAEEDIWRDEDHGKGDGSPMAWLFLPKLEERILGWVESKESE